MSDTGYLTVRAFASSAQLPIEGAAITITQPGSGGTKLLASRLTDENGAVAPVRIRTPDLQESQQAGGSLSYTAVDITADHPDYERIVVENVQIFPGVLSRQNLEMIPVDSRPETWNMTEVFPISAQEL